MTVGGRVRQHFRKQKALLIVVAACVVLVVIIIALSGALKAKATLTIDARMPPDCAGTLSYNVALQSGDEGIANARVAIYANGVLLERLRTDQNGRFASTQQLRPEWCGKPVTLSATYDGSLTELNATNATTVIVRIPTTISLTVPDEAEQGAATPISVRLLSTNGTPLKGKPVLIMSLNVTIDAPVTDATGYAATSYTFDALKQTNVQATFAGDEQYQTATQSKLVIVRRPMCADGTTVTTCSTQVGYLCTATKQLVFDCTKCGCVSGLLCSSNKCVTQEQKNTALITSLQKSVVLVGYINPDGSGVSGSGVVLAQQNGETTILTNRHVVNDAPSVTAVKVLTIDGQKASADTIQIASSGMDLAIITITGTYGTPATIDESALEKGQDVVVLGSPGGLNGDILQGSVAKGIISNFETQPVYFDNTGYTYNAIQTDAAINHGNSGGGLFLLSNGHLVGINTLGGASLLKQGINFAIDIKELQRLPSYTSWPAFTPTPKCQDGTAYNTCSTTNTGFQCVSGTLTPSCKTCGCPSTYPYCPSSGICFKCNTGYQPYQTSTGQGFCCASGTQGTTDGRCV